MPNNENGGWNVKLSDELQKALTEFATYRTQVKTILNTATENYATLKTGFSGSAEEGYQTFYAKAVDGFFEAGGSFDKYLNVFDDPTNGVLKVIENTFVGNEGMDPSLGEQNKSSAGTD